MRSEPSPLAVSVRSVRKKYRLFARSKDRLKEALHPFGKRYHSEFWALDGVSLDVPQGQCLGILGANGSGKSTLLQVIAGIRPPSEGEVKTYGRIAALLELGAGFNPDFTGRDNVLLQGAINGVPAHAMNARMAAIQAFAEIGDFFDQPVKTYSSGMFVRLAFAVAIHVDADILIVDEALAVGDARFQNKCFERIAAIREAGKTIILVTHDVAAIAKHCERALVMDHGRVVFDGRPAEAADRYYSVLYPAAERALPLVTAPGDGPSSGPQPGEDPFWNDSAHGTKADHCRARVTYNRNETVFGDGRAEIVDYLLLGEDGHELRTIEAGHPLRIVIKAHIHSAVDKLTVGFALKLIDGLTMFGTNTGSALFNEPIAVSPGEVRFFTFRCELALSPGDYFLDLGLGEDDATPPGKIIQVRRSIAHLAVVAPGPVRHTGLVDAKISFSALAAPEAHQTASPD